MSESEKTPGLIQRAARGQSPHKTTKTRQARSPFPALTPVFFDVRLRDEQDFVQQVQAGKTYTLALIGSPMRSTLHAQGILMPNGIDLRFHYKTDINVALQLDIADSSFSLLHQEAVCFKREFLIKIPEDFPCCNLICGLTCTLPQTYPETLGEHKIAVKGTYTPEDPQLLEVSQIDAGLPEQAVILLVEPDSHLSTSPRDTFKLRGWSHWGEQLGETARPGAIVSIAELQQRDDNNPVALIDKLTLFSATISENLTKWLCTLHEKYAEQLCVVVVDNTKLEIPWEIFQIDDGQYLGAVAKVVRWLPFRRFTRRPSLQVEDVLYSGPTIAYLDKNLGEKGTKAEREILQKLTIEQLCETLEDLELRLTEPLDRAGLIYVGCHGLSGMQLYTETQQQLSDELRSIHLETMYWSPRPGLIAFMNACESARILKNDDIDPSNFVEAFLTHCASGYIGTLAGVGIQRASIIAMHILKAAMQPGGVQIAEMLRVLRAEAVELLKRARPLSREQKRILLYNVIDIFMYVYYGNPLARLHLHATHQREEEV